MPHPHFDDEDWARVERDTGAWWAGELDRPLVYLSATDPDAPQPPHRYLSNHPPGLTADEVVDLHQPAIDATRYYGDAFPWWWMNFGPGILAGFLGGGVHSVAEPSETVWFGPSAHAPAGRPAYRLDPRNPWWRRVEALTAAAVERWGGGVAIGHTDLGGNLDVLASLRGTQALALELVDRPEEIECLAREVTRWWLHCYDALDLLIRPACRGTTCWTPLWSPGRTYVLQSDFSCMISPAMFERFVLPDLTACCDALDHAFYHLDGPGATKHLDQLLSIERLRGIQWIPGEGQPPPHRWLPLLKRIRDAGKLCQLFVTPDGARAIVDALGGRGFLLVIDHDGRDFRDPEPAHAFLRTLGRDRCA